MASAEAVLEMGSLQAALAGAAEGAARGGGGRQAVAAAVAAAIRTWKALADGELEADDGIDGNGAILRMEEVLAAASRACGGEKLRVKDLVHRLEKAPGLRSRLRRLSKTRNGAAHPDVGLAAEVEVFLGGLLQAQSKEASADSHTEKELLEEHEPRCVEELLDGQLTASSTVGDPGHDPRRHRDLDALKDEVAELAAGQVAQRTEYTAVERGLQEVRAGLDKSAAAQAANLESFKDQVLTDLSGVGGVIIELDNVRRELAELRGGTSIGAEIAERVAGEVERLGAAVKDHAQQVRALNEAHGMLATDLEGLRDARASRRAEIAPTSTATQESAEERDAAFVLKLARTRAAERLRVRRT